MITFMDLFHNVRTEFPQSKEVINLFFTMSYGMEHKTFLNLNDAKLWFESYAKVSRDFYFAIRELQ
jgi:hypothetical protein